MPKSSSHLVKKSIELRFAGEADKEPANVCWLLFYFFNSYGMGKILFDRHHIIPKSRGGSDNEINLVRMLRAEHEDLHALFQCDLPHEQIQKLLQLYETAMTRSFKKEIAEVLLDNQDKYYIPNVWKK